MSNLSLTDIEGELTSIDAINANFQKIEDEFGKVLFRDGDHTPNHLERDVDINSRRLFNLPEEPEFDHEAVRWGKMKVVLDDVVSIRDSIVGYVEDAQSAASEAEDHANNAGEKASEAETFKSGAEGFRDEAEGFRDEAEGFRDETQVLRDEAKDILEVDNFEFVPFKGTDETGPSRASGVFVRQVTYSPVVEMFVAVDDDARVHYSKNGYNWKEQNIWSVIEDYSSHLTSVAANDNVIVAGTSGQGEDAVVVTQDGESWSVNEVPFWSNIENIRWNPYVNKFQCVVSAGFYELNENGGVIEGSEYEWSGADEVHHDFAFTENGEIVVVGSGDFFRYFVPGEGWFKTPEVLEDVPQCRIEYSEDLGIFMISVSAGSYSEDQFGWFTFDDIVNLESINDINWVTVERTVNSIGIIYHPDVGFIIGTSNGIVVAEHPEEAIYVSPEETYGHPARKPGTRTVIFLRFSTSNNIGKLVLVPENYDV